MLETGHVLNNTYRIVRLIGEGGMGHVYEAMHARLAGRYAVKVLLASLYGDADALVHFDREARITSSLQHPNIVQVIDFDRTADGVPYLVMEYLQGETLTNRLVRKGPLPAAEVAEIVEQIAGALSAAHAHGIVHRDLKPDNLFLVSVEGRPRELLKILDFGISKIKGLARGPDGPVSASLMGTPQYMAPEQCQGRSEEVDAASDQFALAAITYEMLTGHPPFQGDSLGTVLSRVLYQEAPAMGVDPAIEKVVKRGLAKERGDRFVSVADFADALRMAVAPKRASPMLERMQPPAPHMKPMPAVGTTRGLAAPSRRWGRGAAVLLALGAVGGATAFVMAKGTPAPWSVQYHAAGAAPTQWPRASASRTPMGTSSSTSGEAARPQPFVPPVTPVERNVPPASSPAAPIRSDVVTPDRETEAPEVVTVQPPPAREQRRVVRRGRASLKTGLGRAVVSPPPLPLDLDEDAPLPMDENFGAPVPTARR